MLQRLIAVSVPFVSIQRGTTLFERLVRMLGAKEHPVEDNARSTHAIPL